MTTASRLLARPIARPALAYLLVAAPGSLVFVRSRGRLLTAAALAVTALVVIGSFLMAGHWGGVA